MHSENIPSWFGLGRIAMDAAATRGDYRRRARYSSLTPVRGGDMELPEIITRLPEADLPFPSTTVKTHVLQSEQGQVVFFQILKDVDLPAHSHKGQWGTVLEGQVEITIGGETGMYGPGSCYYIPAGVVHSARAPAGAKVIEFFEEPDRYRVK
jgi:quercetin dioxygenase-like cupin family protein